MRRSPDARVGGTDAIQDARGRSRTYRPSALCDLHMGRRRGAARPDREVPLVQLFARSGCLRKRFLNPFLEREQLLDARALLHAIKMRVAIQEF
jgi:hypothetical protein